MSPYVPGFSVYPEYGFEAGTERPQRRAVSVVEVVVVLQPGREVPEVAYRPGSFPKFPNKIFGRLSGAVHESSNTTGFDDLDHLGGKVKFRFNETRS